MRPFTRLFKDHHDRALAVGGTSALAVYVQILNLIAKKTSIGDFHPATDEVESENRNVQEVRIRSS